LRDALPQGDPLGCFMRFLHVVSLFLSFPDLSGCAIMARWSA
jgi:hypothetical protein